MGLTLQGQTLTPTSSSGCPNTVINYTLSGGQIVSTPSWQIVLGTGSLSSFEGLSTSVTWQTSGVVVVSFPVLVNGNTVSDSRSASFTLTDTSGGTISGVSSVCAGGSGTLSLSGASPGTVTWQSCTAGCSTSNDTGWTAIGSGSFSNLTTTTSFRVKVTGTACGTRYSNIKTVTVDPMVTPTVSLSAIADKCLPGGVTLTANPTHQGTSPTYAFYFDGAQVASGSSATYTTGNLSAGAHSAYVVLTSNAPCATSATATSATRSFNAVNKTTFTVTNNGPAQICSGTSTGTFVATTPGALGNLSYQWYKNGSILSGETAQMLLNQPIAPGNTIYCVVSSDYWCINTPVQSNTYTVNITPSTTPSVGIQVPKLNFCTGETIAFTSSQSAATYSWRLNGTQFSTTSPSSALPVSTDVNAANTFSPGDIVTLDVTGLSGTCLTTTSASATTSGIPFVINPIVTPAVSLTAIADKCLPGGVTLTANPTNQGTSPTYTFFLDNVQVASGTSATYTTGNLSAGAHSAYVVLTSNAPCTTSATATSATRSFNAANKTTYTVTNNGPGQICSGTSTGTFVATAAGALGNLSYQWYKNGSILSGETGSMMSNQPVAQGNTIYCVVSSDYWCINTPVQSNTYTVNITASTTPTVGIQVPKLNFCTGETIVFTSSQSAATYSWRLNGTQFSTANPSSALPVSTDVNAANTFSPGDVVTLDVTGLSGTCLTTTSASATTSGLPFVINPLVTPGVINNSSACAATPIVFTATPSNGGATPTYAWQVNEVTVSSGTSNTFSQSTLVTGNRVRVIMTSSAACPSPATATSNSITVNKSNYTVTINGDNQVCGASPTGTFTASVTNGLGTLTYQWLKNGIAISGATAATLSNHPIAVGNTISCRVTSDYWCVNSPVTSTITIINIAAPAANTYSLNEWDPMSFTTTGYPYNGSMKWYSDAACTNLIYSGITYSVNLNAGGYTYYVKPVTASGCTGTTASPITITINGNLDQYLNWTQSTAYSNARDAGGNQLVAGGSKSYSNGLGQLLQAQSKSMASNQVFASQPINDRYNQAALSTLPAPINSSTFGYKHKFMTNAANLKYNANDFDIPQATNAAAEVNSPNPVANGGIGTLGWYYSNSNTLEPRTPTTSFPYSRSFTPEGPDPTTSTSAGPGDSYRMGSGHEVKSERLKFNKSELAHYFNLQPLFFKPSPMVEGTNLITVNPTADNLAGFTVSGAGTLSNPAPVLGQTRVQFVPGSTSGTQGIFPIGGTITVVPGKNYKLWVLGHRLVADARLRVRNVTGNVDIVTSGPALPSGAANEAWVEHPFIAPAGCTSIQVGVHFRANGTGRSMLINAIAVVEVLPASDPVMGYKYISTDPDGKKSVTFVDMDGKELASAVVTATTPTLTYDYWNYNFYNDMGQLLATVAPEGVVAGGTTLPNFLTTFKYDHFGRLIETTSIDEGTTRYVYSTDGKIRFSQNQEQFSATTKRFSYTNYDFFGRLVESGEYTQSGTGFYVFETVSAAAPVANSVLNIADNDFARGIDIDNVTSAYVGISKKLDATRCTDHAYIKYDRQPTDLPTGDALHATQNNLFGEVSRTQNANATTWYSYDEFGQLEWTKQNIVGMALNKTVDYTYDYFGNVTQVAYQKNQPDAYNHFYVYDADQRLKEVYSTAAASYNATDVRAKYFYYLHGPLKRVELANGECKQGIDYVYTIDGGLKSINSSDPANDPGQDHLTTTPDFFGETLHYNDTDYASGGYTASGVVLPTTYPGSFSGNLRAVSYNNSTELNAGGVGKARHLYGYQYDLVNQLTNAQWGSLSGTTPTFTEAQREQIPNYDKNGNIKSLVRKGKQAQITGDYAYAYETNTNKLDKINHNSVQLVDYTYNAIGQMTRQNESLKKDFLVSYTPYGLVKEVKDYDTLYNIQTYDYDDRGELIKKTNYAKATALNTPSTPIKATFYVSDASGNLMALYEQSLPAGTVVQREVPVYGAGRVAVYKPQASAYLYEVSDHLGNVRAVCALPVKTTETFFATMESEFAEQPPFKNITATRVNNIVADHTHIGRPDLQTGSVVLNEAARLNSAKPAGPVIGLAVSPGDVINIDVWAYYEAASTYANQLDVATMITAIATAFGGVSGGAGEAGRIFNRVNTGFSGILGNNASATLPSAFLTWRLYDRNDNLLTWGSRGVTPAGANAQERLVSPAITVEQPGLLYITLYNRSNSTNFVYFDDLTVTQAHSRVVVGSDFYPFGLAMDGTEITDEAYRYGYQGQFSEKDLTTGWNEFELRMYDARFGRWLSPDPYGQFASPYVGMGNNPTLSVDPDGGFCCEGPATMDALTEGMTQVVLDGAASMANWDGLVFPTLLGGATSLGGTVLPAAVNISVEFGGAAGRGTGITDTFFEPVQRTITTNFTQSAISQVNPVPLALSMGKAPSVGLSMMSAATLQTALGVAGWIPGVQTIAGIAEAGVALYRGDYWGASFAVLGAIPVLGYLAKAGKALKSAYKISGVYDITVMGARYNGRYIGESSDIVKRLKRHTGFFGKFRGHNIQINEIYSMPGSSSRYREALEQQVLNTWGGPNAPGVLNKINPHRQSATWKLF
jgi:RHS repeat-associated protein